MAVEKIKREALEAAAAQIKSSLAEKAKPIENWKRWFGDLSLDCFPFGVDHTGEYGEPQLVALFPDGSIRAIDRLEGTYYGDWMEVSPAGYLKYGEVAERAIDKLLNEGVEVREELWLLRG